MLMEERALPIVIVGHVDHGKSTLIGRLLYDTGCLPPDKFSEIQHSSETLGRNLEFAFVMDCFEEERSRGITIDTTQTFFKTPKRRYVIIDAPGHKEFLKNMITGSSQAEAALLIIDAFEGIRDQTRRHAYILGMLGFKQVCVLLNKIDLVHYSQDKFLSLKGEVIDFLNQLNVHPTFILPISAIHGDNVAKPSEKISWFDGPTVLQALDTFEPLKIEEKPLRFPIQDIYTIDGKKTIVGRIEAGELKKGQSVYLLPEKKKVEVKEIKKFLEKDVSIAHFEESIGIRLKGRHRVKRGQILTADLSSWISDQIKANIFWLDPTGYRVGEALLFRCVTQEVPCRIDKINRKFDPASMELTEEDASSIKGAEVADVLLQLDEKVAVDPFNEIPEMGRFVLEKEGRPAAGGIIL
ncbi:MAG: 50S ribosome-binding GTPase [Syntrophaceae bacterium]|nr:50S ribosome-binding GTPase [Syntrophaceae bacterium]